MPLHRALPARPALADALSAREVTLAQLEASVRSGARSDRMMIERAPAGALDDVLTALAVPRVSVFDELLDAAAALDQPLIVGWDGAQGMVKLYLNASDAPDAVRAKLGARLGGRPAHVYGVNVFSDGTVENKRYTQVRNADGFGPEAARLFAAAEALSAGAVACHTRQVSLHAFFVALRPATPAVLDDAFGYLEGFSWNTLVACAPFPPASPRSIGISVRHPDRWTAYLKPRGTGEPELFQLDPQARFRSAGPNGDTEIAVYVEPSDNAARAYARVHGLAISYRVVGGAPTAEALSSLLGWVVETLRARPDTRFARQRSDLPVPWRQVTRE